MRLLLPPLHDELVTRLRLPGLVPQGRLPPRGDRAGHPDRRLPFAPPVRMARWIHAHPADVGAPPHPARATGLADADRLVLDVTDLAHGRAAVEVDHPHLARGQTHLRVLALLGHQLGGPTGAPHQLAPAADLKFE